MSLKSLQLTRSPLIGAILPRFAPLGAPKQRHPSNEQEMLAPALAAYLFKQFFWYDITFF